MRITIKEAAAMVGLTVGAIRNWIEFEGLTMTRERKTGGPGPAMVETLDKAEFEAVARRRGYEVKS